MITEILHVMGVFFLFVGCKKEHLAIHWMTGEIDSPQVPPQVGELLVLPVVAFGCLLPLGRLLCCLAEAIGRETGQVNSLIIQAQSAPYNCNLLAKGNNKTIKFRSCPLKVHIFVDPSSTRIHQRWAMENPSKSSLLQMIPLHFAQLIIFPNFSKLFPYFPYFPMGTMVIFHHFTMDSGLPSPRPGPQRSARRALARYAAGWSGDGRLCRAGTL